MWWALRCAFSGRSFQNLEFPYLHGFGRHFDPPATQRITEEFISWNYGKFNMADDTLRRPCQSGKDSYLFDLAGDNVKWKTVSLTHVEYPEGNYSSYLRLSVAFTGWYFSCFMARNFTWTFRKFVLFCLSNVIPHVSLLAYVLLFVAGDIVGKILAWCSLLPIFIVVGFITLIVFRREIHTVSRYYHGSYASDDTSCPHPSVYTLDISIMHLSLAIPGGTNGKWAFSWGLMGRFDW